MAANLHNRRDVLQYKGTQAAIDNLINRVLLRRSGGYIYFTDAGAWHVLWMDFKHIDCIILAVNVLGWLSNK